MVMEVDKGCMLNNKEYITNEVASKKGKEINEKEKNDRCKTLYKVSVGGLGEYNHANKLICKLKREGYVISIESIEGHNGCKTLYRVSVDGLLEYNNARKLALKLKKEGYIVSIEVANEN